jgi:hypothetical protein
MLFDLLARLLAREEVRPPPWVPPGVRIRRGRSIPAFAGWISRMGSPAAAVTLGRTIVIHPAVSPTERLLRHELAHVEQWRRHPLIFPIDYVWKHIRYGYTDNPYEKQARDAED